MISSSHATTLDSKVESSRVVFQSVNCQNVQGGSTERDPCPISICVYLNGRGIVMGLGSGFWEWSHSPYQLKSIGNRCSQKKPNGKGRQIRHTTHLVTLQYSLFLIALTD